LEKTQINGVSPESTEFLGVNFATEHRNIISYLTNDKQRILAIPENYQKFIISLGTTYASVNVG
jgi:hypothetical protein